ncbi:MAG: hypothetical protein IJZ29_01195 [Clostridia bacterium]|nr:hypothetical protein [Clostridia bacterium]
MVSLRTNPILLPIPLLNCFFVCLVACACLASEAKPLVSRQAHATVAN